MTYETTDGAVRAEQLLALTLPNRDGRRPKVNLKHWVMAAFPHSAKVKKTETTIDNSDVVGGISKGK